MSYVAHSDAESVEHAHTLTAKRNLEEQNVCHVLRFPLRFIGWQKREHETKTENDNKRKTGP